MPVDAVRTDIKDAVFKPFDAEIGLVERPARDRGERCDPVKPPAMLGPEAVRVVERPPIHVGILSGIHIGASRPFRRHWNKDRKSVGEGKSGSVRLGLGGRRIIKKKKKKKHKT